MRFTLSPLDDIRPDTLDALILESEEEGWHFLRRLADEWGNGSNRFNQPGEALFVARLNGAVVGVCGLNADPYGGDPAIGRVRRLYVARAQRRCGVGRQLVEAVVRAATGRFRILHLRTANPEAARLYQRLGFTAAVGVPDCTHTLALSLPDADVLRFPAQVQDKQP
jgi:GNAT superfamily N-acetyltransferase